MKKTKEMFYYVLSHKIISFALFSQPSQPSMNSNISELAYYIVLLLPCTQSSGSAAKKGVQLLRQEEKALMAK